MQQHFKTFKYSKVEFRPLLFGTNRSIYSKYMNYMILQVKHLPAEVMDGFQERLFQNEQKEISIMCELTTSLKPPNIRH